MPGRTAIIAGATGLVGSHLLDQLLESDYQKIKVISRSPTGKSNTRLEEIITDLDHMSEKKNLLQGDDVFCCLGTTIKKAGSKEQFYKVDYSYPAELARITKEMGARKFFLVTAIGSNKNSKFFYSRVKGEIEETVSDIDFETVHIFRPSLLLGKRRENRWGETIGKWITFIIWPMFVGPLRKYKPIKASKVASAMLNAAQKHEKGIFYYDSEQIERLS